VYEREREREREREQVPCQVRMFQGFFWEKAFFPHMTVVYHRRRNFSIKLKYSPVQGENVINS